jgi:hypothetical protein
MCDRSGSELVEIDDALVHEACALWSPVVYEDAAGNLCNVAKEIRRGSKMR